LSVVLGGTPDTYQLAGHGRGTATSKFNDYQDNLLPVVNAVGPNRVDILIRTCH
jgi:hypothetical protein